MKKLNAIAILVPLTVLLFFSNVRPVVAKDKQPIVDCDAKSFTSREPNPDKNSVAKGKNIRWNVYADTEGTVVTFYFKDGSPFDDNVPSSFTVKIGDEPETKKKKVQNDTATKEYKYSIICTLPNGTEQWRLDPIIEVP